MEPEVGEKTHEGTFGTGGLPVLAAVSPKS
jgi:hypothetical protein